MSIYNFDDQEGRDHESMEDKIRHYRNAIRQGKIEEDPPSPETLEEIIYYCMENENFNDALEFGRIWTKVEPYSSDAWLKLGIIESNLERFSESLLSFDKALEISPMDTYSLIQKALSFAKLGQNSNAMDLIDTALTLEPDNEEAVFHKGMILEIQFKFNEAIHLFEYLKGSKQFAKDALQEIAFCYHYLENYNQAIKYYNLAIDEDPFDYNLWYNLGVVHSQKEQHYKAVDCFEMSLAINEEFFLSWHNLGNSFSSLGRLNESIKSYKEALYLRRNDLETLYNLASVYGDLGNYVKAIKLFSKVINKRDTHYQSYFGRGVCYDAIDNWEKALRDYNKALTLNKSNPDLWYAKADLLYNLNRFEESIECYRKVIELDPTNIDSWYDYGCTLFDYGKYVESENAFMHLIELDPNWSEGYYSIAKCYAVQDRLEDCIKYLKKAIDLEKDRVDDLKNDFPDLVDEEKYDYLLKSVITKSD